VDTLRAHASDSVNCASCGTRFVIPQPLAYRGPEESRRDGITARTTYHHGDLKAEALRAALRAIEAGEGAVPSMRALAETLGVGHRALYNHFADREALLAAIAAEGFARLAESLGTAQDERSHLRAYIDFALKHPGLYAVMMERPYASFNDDAALSAAVDEVIAASLHAIARDGDDPDTQRRDVMRVWMLAHGGLALHRAGALKMRSDASFAEELMRIAFR
tara:strand:- start:218 stop:880 length:663 start_codon:yes stop_codon:yes gene_type:complete